MFMGLFLGLGAAYIHFTTPLISMMMGYQTSRQPTENHPQPTLNLDLAKTVQVSSGQNGNDCAQQDGWLQVLEPMAWQWFNIISVDSKPKEPELHQEFSSHFPSVVLVGHDLVAFSISQTSMELYYSWHSCFCISVCFLEQTLLF